VDEVFSRWPGDDRKKKPALQTTLGLSPPNRKYTPALSIGARYTRVPVGGTGRGQPIPVGGGELRGGSEWQPGRTKGRKMKKWGVADFQKKFTKSTHDLAREGGHGA